MTLSKQDSLGRLLSEVGARREGAATLQRDGAHMGMAFGRIATRNAERFPDRVAVHGKRSVT
jgi:hypothetical protein